jgi:predicted O-methyltransferase YrrM
MSDSVGTRARRAYVSAAHAARTGLDRSGLLRRWDARVRTRPGGPGAHLRSLLSVYDAADLARLGLPWWTYGATTAVERFLADRCDGQAAVFEFGSGASTVWLAERAERVTSVEHDVGFAPTVQALLAGRGLADRVALHVVPPRASDAPVLPSAARGQAGLDFADYVGTLARVGGRFDLVVVDGRARAACLTAGLEHLRPGGLLLLDDAQRRRYADALAAAARAGWRVDRYRGAAPTVPLPRETALVHRP